MKKILVLSSAESEYTKEANRVFVREITARMKGVKVETCHYDDIAFLLSKGRIVASRLSTSSVLSNYSLVYFKSFYRYSEIASAIAAYLQQERVPYICHEIDDSISFTKLTQYTTLARQQLPIIPSVFVERSQWANGGIALIEGCFGFPCIFKAIDGKGGDVNYVVKTGDELLDKVNTHTCDFIAQQFIPNEYDLRVLVAGSSVSRVIKRQRQEGASHLNNTSKGAVATLISVDKLDMSIQKLACSAASLFKREIAGVDIMTDSSTGGVYILEVNASPQVATGAFREEKLDVYADFFSKLLNN